ncbi:MAG TPA: chemotaxis-specific protein-glutamate methyltransferase CheB [Novosphingobium sp.]|nr:chemotaxis-specific protein-glutamate methyltransferase CheB [Novosphingobium sp.]
MVVDDSAIVRTVFANIIRREPDLELTATAATAEEGLALLSIRPVDIVLLDLEMPGMGGLDALPRMLAAVPGLQILVVSSLTRAGAEPTLKALALGAADTLAKPTSGKFDDEYRLRLVTRLRALGRLTGRQGPIPSQPPRPAVVTRRPGPKRPQVLAIGASTGGIHALSHFLGALPATIGLPILVTQHLPASFMEAFARQLVTASGREAVVAQDGEALIADRILIAPGDAHLTVMRQGKRLVVRHDCAPAASGCLPSVDPMFASLAAACDGEVLGIVLSGMGRDGADGAARIVEAGGTILAQDEASSAVWGMPGAVAKAGLAAAILPPVQLALRIGARPALAS